MRTDEQSDMTRADGRTVGHDETNSRFSRFCERAWKWILEEIRCKVVEWLIWLRRGENEGLL